jgi:hypothetical protein
MSRLLLTKSEHGRNADLTAGTSRIRIYPFGRILRFSEMPIV